MNLICYDRSIESTNRTAKSHDCYKYGGGDNKRKRDMLINRRKISLIAGAPFLKCTFNLYGFLCEPGSRSRPLMM